MKRNADGFYVFNSAKFIGNYDGDSLYFSVPNVHPLFGEKMKVRLLGIDTPELRSKSNFEKIKAIEARDFVKEQLENAKQITITALKLDSFGRVLAYVSTKEIEDLSQLLLQKGLATVYED